MNMLTKCKLIVKNHPFPLTALQHRLIGDSSLIDKMDYVKVTKSFLNPEGYQNSISGFKVTAILLKALILPIGGVAFGRVCASSLRSRLVLERPQNVKYS